MIIFGGLIVLLSFLGIYRSRCGKSSDIDYMSLNMTNSIKGVFLCMVFLSHICGYADFFNLYLDRPYQMVRRITGQCIVAMFLFYSGYGIMESIKAKGINYVNKIPRHRFAKVLLQFDAAIALFWLYRYITGAQYGVKKMILNFIGWDGIGNSNWYIFCILWLYIFTYIVFKTFYGGGVFKQYIKSVIGLIVLSVLYMAFVSKLGKEIWWYDTILCYAYGMLFSLYREKIEQNVIENGKTWFFYLVTFAIGFLAAYLYKNENTVIYETYIFCFVGLIVVFTMRYAIDSKPLQWVGENLFELYILQRLPMMIFSRLMPWITEGWYKYLYVILCIVATLAMAVIFKKTISRIINRALSV